jgi:spermidine/putrescine ABC transporter ATP-binding subunit
MATRARGSAVEVDALPTAAASATTIVGAASVRLEGIEHRFGDVEVLREISLSVAAGEFVTLLGPSGSGKTTLLRILGGLLEPARGRILVDGREVTHLPPHKRNVGFVFQHYALFPHMSVYQNVAFPLGMRKVKKVEMRKRVEQTLELVRLEDYARRRPAELSGGQQQRVALARALVFEPNLLLMDEPLGALDKHLREALQRELRALQQQVGITTIYVTHDQNEAFAMSDRIAVMHNGHVCQVDAPGNLYANPCDSFVASFVGELNEFVGRVDSVAGAAVEVAADGGIIVRARRSASVAAGARVRCGIRPERVVLGATAPGENRYSGRVVSVRNHGSRRRCEIELAGATIVVADLSVDAPPVPEGEAVEIGWRQDDVYVFPAETAE